MSKCVDRVHDRVTGAVQGHRLARCPPTPLPATSCAQRRQARSTVPGCVLAMTAQSELRHLEKALM